MSAHSVTHGEDTPGPDPAGRLDRTRLTVATGPLAAPVLARLVGIHAARAGLTVDRLDDAVLVTDALADAALEALALTHLGVSIQSDSGRIELRVGPLPAGAAQRLLDAAALPGTGPIVRMLADAVNVRSGSAGGETLVVRIAARQPAAPARPAG